MWQHTIWQLSATATEDVVKIFNNVVIKYEEELSRLRAKEELYKTTDHLFNPSVCLNRLDVQQTVLIKKEDPEMPDVNPELLHIKELPCTEVKQEEQLSVKEEADATMSPLPTTSEDEEPQLPQLLKKD